MSDDAAPTNLDRAVPDAQWGAAMSEYKVTFVTEYGRMAGIFRGRDRGKATENAHHYACACLRWYAIEDVEALPVRTEEQER